MPHLSTRVAYAKERLRQLLRVPIQHVDGADPTWYDEVYQKRPEAYTAHYTRSLYYFLWTVVVDRLRASRHVLELGCGTGQFAQLLFDQGVSAYTGFDFSDAAIKIARARLPEADFRVDDALTTDLFESIPYDVVVATEVLEHIPSDLDVIGRIRVGSRVVATLPNFDWTDHVRHFTSPLAVRERYSGLLEEMSVVSFPRDDGSVFFLMDGRRSRSPRSISDGESDRAKRCAGLIVSDGEADGEKPRGQ